MFRAGTARARRSRRFGGHPSSSRGERRPGPRGIAAMTDVSLHETVRTAPAAAGRSGPTAREDSSMASCDAPGRELAAFLRAEVGWRALEPRGLYARFGRPLFLHLLFVLTLPVAAALGLGIALVNWMLFGRLGDVLFRQARVGHRGHAFSIYKFRTMRAGARSDFESWADGQDRQRVT